MMSEAYARRTRRGKQACPQAIEGCGISRTRPAHLASLRCSGQSSVHPRRVDRRHRFVRQFCGHRTLPCRSVSSELYATEQTGVLAGEAGGLAQERNFRGGWCDARSSTTMEMLVAWITLRAGGTR